jgi:hypothetical protein
MLQRNPPAPTTANVGDGSRADDPNSTPPRARTLTVAEAMSQRAWYMDVCARAANIHRYLPEWADRTATCAIYREAEQNSYLAGGYAEEFGYRQQQGCRAVVHLIGDPECRDLWSAHVGGLHPGYPECGAPHEREARHAYEGAAVADSLLMRAVIPRALRPPNMSCRHAWSRA